MVISILSISYNTFKIIPEVINWGLISDSEKRYKLFGDLYTLLIFANQHTSTDSKILLISNDPKAFYLGRYYLYPRKMEIMNSANEPIQENINEYDYIVVKIDEIGLLNAKKYNLKKYKQLNKIGVIYKIK